MCLHDDLEEEIENPLFEKRLGLVLVGVVDQLQVHVHEEWVEDLRKLRSVAVQDGLDELLKSAVVNLIERWVALLAVR